MSRNRMRIAVGTSLLTVLIAACKWAPFAGDWNLTAYLEFVGQPTAVPAGVTIFPSVVVRFVYSDSSCSQQLVTLTLSGAAGGTLGGTAAQVPVNGSATFADLSVDRPGTYALTATAACVKSGSSQPFTITGPVVSVGVEPPSPGLTTLGATLQLAAYGRDAANIASGGRFTWTSSDTTKVQVSTGGLVTAVAYGSATVAAALGGVSGSTLVRVALMPGAVASLDVGINHTCGVISGGAAYCWGDNSSGQLGIGAVGPLPIGTPLAVTGGVLFASASAGFGHTCGVTVGGRTYCWGNNYLAQLGNGTTTNQSAPTAVAGSLSFAAVSAGFYHTCAVTSGGAAYCWGANPLGQLGIGSADQLHHTAPIAVAGGLTLASVSAGYNQTCAVTTGGAAYCWGDNTYGQIGDGSQTSRPSPVAVAGGLTFASLSTFVNHTCGVTAGGRAYCWGYNSNGQLGDGTMTNRSAPVAVTGNLSFVAVSGGLYHTCGVTTGGAAYCWGANSFGQLGIGAVDQALHTAPVAVGGGLTFASVSAGYYHTCGVTTGGVAYCWGDNTSGQLGTAAAAFNSAVPVAVAGQASP